jgi:hypothetical protein
VRRSCYLSIEHNRVIVLGSPLLIVVGGLPLKEELFLLLVLLGSLFLLFFRLFFLDVGLRVIVHVVHSGKTEVIDGLFGFLTHGFKPGRAFLVLDEVLRFVFETFCYFFCFSALS